MSPIGKAGILLIMEHRSASEYPLERLRAVIEFYALPLEVLQLEPDGAQIQANRSNRWDNNGQTEYAFQITVTQ